MPNHRAARNQVWRNSNMSHYPNYVIERTQPTESECWYWAGNNGGKRKWSRNLDDAIIVHSETRAEEIISASAKGRIYKIRELAHSANALQKSGELVNA